MSNDLFSQIQGSVNQALASVVGSFLTFLPQVIGALIVFVVGIILSKWLKFIVVKVLEVLRVSELIAKTSFKEVLENAEVTNKIETLLGELVRYLVILVFFVASINILGLSTVTQVLNGLLGYLPTIFAAIFILAVGVVLAGIFEKLIKGAFGSFDLKLSRVMGKFTSYLTITFAVLAAFSQLGIAKNLIDTLFIGFVGMLALALGLSLGLGSKDLVKSLLEDWHKSFKKEMR